jgi:hypothetical protein
VTATGATNAIAVIPTATYRRTMVLAFSVMVPACPANEEVSSALPGFLTTG